MKTINIIITISLILIVCLQVGIFILNEKQNKPIVFTKDEIIKKSHLNREILIVQDTIITIPEEAIKWKGIIKLRDMNEQVFTVLSDVVGDDPTRKKLKTTVKNENINISISNLLSSQPDALTDGVRLKNDTILSFYNIELIFADGKIFLRGKTVFLLYELNGILTLY